jgi:transposase
VRFKSVWRQLLGLSNTVVEGVEFEDATETLVVSVRPSAKARRRCGRCGRRAPWYDRGDGRRRWRAVDFGAVEVRLEADAPRVSCPVHGATVIQVPWARHTAGHTRDFDDTVAWLAVHTSRSAVTEFMRVAWRTVGAVVARVSADIDAQVDRLAGLRRIGIDEISYKRGQRYLTVVVDHDSGRLVWAAPGRDAATVGRFFTLLGPARCAQITHVSADAATWIAKAVATHCPRAVQCADPFHVVAWAIDALDVVRRHEWNRLRDRRPIGYRSRRTPVGEARAIKHSRYVLWKNPENLTTAQQTKLDWIAKSHPLLYRAYLLKEALRVVFRLGGDEGKEALSLWLAWASRSRIPAFVDLAKKIRAYRTAIDATLEHGMSNARVEAVNTRIRLLTRIAFGFHRADALIGLALLSLGGHPPVLPGRA